MKVAIACLVLAFSAATARTSWAQYKAVEPAKPRGPVTAGTCFSVYREADGSWYVQNDCSTPMTARLLFTGTNSVFALEDCLPPHTRKFLWWMTANPTLTLQLVGASGC